MGDYQVIEHTADVGVRGRGHSLEEAFAQTTLGLLEITGTFRPDRVGESHSIEVEGRDLGAVLIDWLSEVLYLQDSKDALISTVELGSVTGTSAAGSVTLVQRGDEDEVGTPVKAITYHQLKVEPIGDEWETQVIVDI